ncbi:hypothetical protein ACFXQA_02415 [Microbacterium sp. P07]|uniref:hypothetical protein n=1 Tax=Microbacterium sp. P07 TaxID=3366952 RepID=UPI0037476D0E
MRKGWFVTHTAWNDLWPEGRHLVQVAAASNDLVGGTHVFSYVSAAVLWKLPLFRVAPLRVHATGTTRLHAASTPGVQRHEDRLDQADVVVVDGIRCTSLERTALDMARVSTPEAAVAVADAALTVGAGVDYRAYDQRASEEWRESMSERLARVGSIRGIRQARWVMNFADGRAQLPGESVSRLQLSRLGFDSPSLQVPVPGPDGSTYWVDIGLDDVFSFGEFDGKTKYRDAAMLHGLSIDDVLLREKQREDWIRGTTHRRLARWGDEHIGTPELLGERLASFGIRPRG